MINFVVIVCGGNDRSLMIKFNKRYLGRVRRKLMGERRGAFFCYEFNRICCYCLDGGTTRFLMAKLDKRYLGRLRSEGRNIVTRNVVHLGLLTRVCFHFR